jgi:hypothetical protein
MSAHVPTAFIVSEHFQSGTFVPQSESTSDGVHILGVQGSEHQVPRKEKRHLEQK